MVSDNTLAVTGPVYHTKWHLAQASLQKETRFPQGLVCIAWFSAVKCSILLGYINSVREKLL